MNHVGWRYYPNPWRKFCNRWWLHWLKLDRIWWDAKDAFQRMRRGWGNGDIFDLMSYHAGVTLGLLRHFKANHHGYIESMGVDGYEAALDAAIDGWEAKYYLLTENDWWDDKELQDKLNARWDKGREAFFLIYDSLWN